VVKIARKDFNSEMDDYIKKRRTSDSTGTKLKDNLKNINEWSVFSMFKRKEKEYNTEEYEDEEDFEDEETEIEAIEEIEDELEERREGVLKRFFKKLRFGRRMKRKPEEDEYEEIEEDEDELEEIKEVIKITHRWLEELPPETIERFKRSEDFQKYKATLKKLGMIK